MTDLAYDYGGINRFLADRCRPNAVSFVMARDLYVAYLEWCNATGMPKYLILTEPGFGRATTQGERRGKVMKRRSRIGVQYLGIELIPAETAAAS